MKMEKKKLLSVILLSYYSGERITKCYNRLNDVFIKENIPFELVVIDDGSSDDSYKIALSLEKKYDNVRAFQLSRNYGSFYALMAGYSKAEGECACFVPDDEQQPYSSVVQMYRLWEKGNKIIVANRESRDDPWLTKFFSELFYRIINALSDNLNYPSGGVDVTLIDREVIDIINERIHPINTNVVAEVLRLGYSPVMMPYKRPIGLNKGKSRWTFKKKLRLAKDIFYSSSTFPIKLITYIGVLTSFFSIIGIVFHLYIRIFGNHQFWGTIVPGWTSLIVIVSLFSGLILFSLGVIAEYIWRIYDEVKARPGYIIKKKDDK